MDTNEIPDTTTALDAAINAAKARKAAREAGTAPVEAPAVEAIADAEPVEETGKRRGRPRLSAEEKAARAADPAKLAQKAERAAERARLAAEREIVRAAKRAAREAKKAAAAVKHPYMGRIATAEAKLPKMSPAAERAAKQLVSDLPNADLLAIAAFLQHTVRASTTAAAGTAAKPVVGSTVTVTGGHHKFVGMVGTVSKVGRIRSYVDVADYKRPLYVLNSDLAPVAAEAAAQ